MGCLGWMGNDTALTIEQLRDNDSSGGSNIDSYKTHRIVHLKWVHFTINKLNFWKRTTKKSASNTLKWVKLKRLTPPNAADKLKCVNELLNSMVDLPDVFGYVAWKWCFGIKVNFFVCSGC